MGILFKTSQSKVRDWRQCKMLYHYKHVQRIQRRRKARPFAFGDIVHKMKERMAQGKDPFSYLTDISPAQMRLFREEREYYGDIIRDVRYIFNGYIDYWEKIKKQPLVFLSRKIDRKTVQAEFSFEIPHDKEDLLIKGTIDAATVHKKMDWLTEHKNHKNIPNDDERWRSIQSAVYIRVSDMLGWWSFEGSCWDYIRSKPPTKPQILKRGGLSERALDSLPEVVIDTLKENKLKVSSYTALIDQQRQNMSTWYQRVYAPIKKKVIDNLWRDFITTSAEMRDTKMGASQPRTIGRHCSWCDFEPLCRAALQGLDEEFLKERDYEESTYGGDQETRATDE